MHARAHARSAALVVNIPEQRPSVLPPAAAYEGMVNAGAAKAAMPGPKIFLLGIMAGGWACLCQEMHCFCHDSRGHRLCSDSAIVVSAMIDCVRIVSVRIVSVSIVSVAIVSASLGFAVIVAVDDGR
eukprot:365047-Chlamydomonas_euryale.AAC.9